MLLQLENTNKKDINKLLNFARQNNLDLYLLDDDKEDKYFLPGQPLTESALNKLIENSRCSGKIQMKDGHAAIRKTFNAD